MYRVVFNPAFENMNVEDFDREYLNLEIAMAVRDAIADYTLMLHEMALMPDYSNYGYIEVMIDGDWVEIEEEC